MKKGIQSFLGIVLCIALLTSYTLPVLAEESDPADGTQTVSDVPSENTVLPSEDDGEEPSDSEDAGEVPSDSADETPTDQDGEVPSDDGEDADAEDTGEDTAEKDAGEDAAKEDTGGEDDAASTEDGEEEDTTGSEIDEPSFSLADTVLENLASTVQVTLQNAGSTLTGASVAFAAPATEGDYSISEDGTYATVWPDHLETVQFTVTLPADTDVATYGVTVTGATVDETTALLYHVTAPTDWDEETDVTVTYTFTSKYTSDVTWYTDATDGNYIIKTEQELRGLAEVVNGTAVKADGTSIAADDFSGETVTLGDDIALTVPWMPIGNGTTYYFDGTFTGEDTDGNYTISGLNVGGADTYIGLFGYLYTNSTVKNLVVEGEIKDVTTSSASVGLVAGYSAGTISNLDVTASVSLESGKNIGGVVGETKGVLDEIAVTLDCFDSVGAASSAYLGGVAGYANAAISLTDLSAVFPDAVTIAPTAAGYFGGIVGNSTAKILTGLRAEFHQIDMTFSGNAYFGGIAAYIASATSTESFAVTFDSDINVSSTSATYFGGAIGSTTAAAQNLWVTVSNSATAFVDSTSTCCAGGVVGKTTAALSDASSNMNFDVTTAGTLAAYAADVGGIAGYSYAVSNAESSGDIVVRSKTTANFGYAGGITGYLYGANSVADCKNSGNISGLCGTSQIGGIVGYVNTAKATLRKSGGYYSDGGHDNQRRRCHRLLQ